MHSHSHSCLGTHTCANLINHSWLVTPLMACNHAVISVLLPMLLMDLALTDCNHCTTITTVYLIMLLISLWNALSLQKGKCVFCKVKSNACYCTNHKLPTIPTLNVSNRVKSTVLKPPSFSQCGAACFLPSNQQTQKVLILLWVGSRADISVNLQKQCVNFLMWSKYDCLWAGSLW